MADPTNRRRSEEACPVCGKHTLALIEFPTVHSVGYLPANEALAMGEPTDVSPPAIGCESCGSEWPSLAAFRAGEPPLAAVEDEDGPEEDDEDDEDDGPEDGEDDDGDARA